MIRLIGSHVKKTEKTLYKRIRMLKITLLSRQKKKITLLETQIAHSSNALLHNFYSRSLILAFVSSSEFSQNLHLFSLYQWRIPMNLHFPTEPRTLPPPDVYKKEKAGTRKPKTEKGYMAYSNKNFTQLITQLVSGCTVPSITAVFVASFSTASSKSPNVSWAVCASLFVKLAAASLISVQGLPSKIVSICPTEPN